MFKNWVNIFTTDCTVVELQNKQYVYPIFKNGRSSLTNFATENNLRIYKNNELAELDLVTVFLRDPVERFVSGVNTVIEFENVSNVKQLLDQIEQLKFYNRHFIPQILWLFHLYKYFKGDIKFRSVTDLYDIIPNRDSPNVKKLTPHRKDQILSINYSAYTDVDERLMYRHLNKTRPLKNIIEEFKHALS